MYSIKVTKRAGKATRRLDKGAARQVAKAIDNIAADPHGAGQKMRGEWTEYWRAWAGDNYRIIYTVDDSVRTVTVTHVFPRGDAPY